MAAHNLFLETGYSKTTIADIARRANVTKRTLYSYFPSKITLYIEMYDYYLERYHQVIVDAVRSEMPTREKLLFLMDSLFAFTKDNEKFMRLFWMIDSEEYGGDLSDDLTERIRNWSIENIREARPLVKLAFEEGVIIDIEPEMLIHLISAVNKGIMTHTHKERKFNIAHIDPESLYSQFRHILLRSIFL
ncbi:MAG: TetR/AcrR family transcriptional regulator [Deltaproteobacteria bacterium]|nr:TetR/AcrR family transcriptional regulator [Candidatus Zymogenaceae bacterium]